MPAEQGVVSWTKGAFKFPAVHKPHPAATEIEKAACLRAMHVMSVFVMLQAVFSLDYLRL